MTKTSFIAHIRAELQHHPEMTCAEKRYVRTRAIEWHTHNRGSIPETMNVPDFIGSLVAGIASDIL